MFFGDPATGKVRERYLHKDVSSCFTTARQQKVYRNVDNPKKKKNK